MVKFMPILWYCHGNFYDKHGSKNVRFPSFSDLGLIKGQLYPEGSKLSVYLHLLQGYWILKNMEIWDKNLTNGKIYADFVIFPSQIAPKIFLRGGASPLLLFNYI